MLIITKIEFNKRHKCNSFTVSEDMVSSYFNGGFCRIEGTSSSISFFELSDVFFELYDTVTKVTYPNLTFKTIFEQKSNIYGIFKKGSYYYVVSLTVQAWNFLGVADEPVFADIIPTINYATDVTIFFSVIETKDSVVYVTRAKYKRLDEYGVVWLDVTHEKAHNILRLYQDAWLDLSKRGVSKSASIYMVVRGGGYERFDFSRGIRSFLTKSTVLNRKV